MMRDKLGGDKATEAMAEKWMEYAEKVRKSNRKAVIVDFNLDMYGKTGVNFSVFS